MPVYFNQRRRAWANGARRNFVVGRGGPYLLFDDDDDEEEEEEEEEEEKASKRFRFVGAR